MIFNFFFSGCLRQFFPSVCLYLSNLSIQYSLHQASVLSEHAALCPVQLDQVVAVKVKPRPLMHDVCQDLGETSSLITVTHMLVGLIVAIYQLVGEQQYL